MVYSSDLQKPIVTHGTSAEEITHKEVSDLFGFPKTTPFIHSLEQVSLYHCAFCIWTSCSHVLFFFFLFSASIIYHLFFV
jgi:hypothetical protein